MHYVPFFCLEKVKKLSWRPVHIFPLSFAIGLIISTNWQRGAQTFDKLSRISRIQVSLIGVKTSLRGALRVYRKVDPTIYDLQSTISSSFFPTLNPFFLLDAACLQSSVGVFRSDSLQPRPDIPAACDNGAAL